VMTTDCQPVNKKYINETGNTTTCRRAVGCVPQYNKDGLTTYGKCAYVNRW
jgi:hypothetical protein